VGADQQTHLFFITLLLAKPDRLLTARFLFSSLSCDTILSVIALATIPYGFFPYRIKIDSD
jgi:hypothetical protein